MKATPSLFRAHALHLEAVTKNVRTHGGGGWTYDEEIEWLRDAATRMARYEKLLRAAATIAHDSGEQDSFEDVINAALK